MIACMQGFQPAVEALAHLAEEGLYIPDCDGDGRDK